MIQRFMVGDKGGVFVVIDLDNEDEDAWPICETSSCDEARFMADRMNELYPTSAEAYP